VIDHADAVINPSLGFVFQAYNLLGSMSAYENVEMPMIIHGSLSADKRRERALYLLQRKKRLI
jgi:putative ABC transport system ATP-binding protein